jgi:GTP-binding protein
VIDAAAGDPTQLFDAIDQELGAYGAELERRPQIVVLNKIDLGEAEFSPPDERVLRVVKTSAATGEGIDELERALFGAIPEPEPVPVQQSELVDFLLYRPRPSRAPFRILRTDRGFRVTGRPPSDEELEEALRAAGARPGDEVEVGEQ